MSRQDTTIDQILALTRQMHQHATDGDWSSLFADDVSRNEILRTWDKQKVAAPDLRQKIEEIERLQQQIMSLVSRAREKMSNEYRQSRHRVDVSRQYLNGTTEAGAPHTDMKNKVG